MGYHDILERLPHRAPMLMVDSILELDGTDCTAVKNLSFSEPCFAGHFPGNPIFPGVLMIEALAQTCSLCLSEREPDKLPIFAGINNARFKSPAHPGDRLTTNVHLAKQEKRFYTFDTKMTAGERLICSAELTIYL